MTVTYGASDAVSVQQSESNLYEWKNWLGLPHQIGADPREGQGACCIQIASILLRNAGLPAPEPDESWYNAARMGLWDYCQKAFEQYTEAIERAELWSLTWVTNGTKGYGIGVVVQENRLIIPHHRKGVVLIPLSVLRNLPYFRFKAS